WSSDVCSSDLACCAKNFPRFTNLLSTSRVWFEDAIDRKPHQCRDLSRGGAWPRFRGRVRSTRTLPVDLVTVASTADRAPCCRELNLLWPKAAWRGGRAAALAHRRSEERRVGEGCGVGGGEG